jgi:hypothetical protein
VAQINFRMKTFVNRPYVVRRINKWKLARLGRVGAYARGAMRKQIRPPLKGRGKKSRTVVIVPVPADMPNSWRGPPPSQIVCFVDPQGMVINLANGRPVPVKVADKARMALRAGKKGQGEGKPPRRGPTDKLRKHIYFSIDVEHESVVIGPEPFAHQPVMPGRVSVPELLNKGGIEIIFGIPVKYGPRPFIETILPPALGKLKQEIARHPVR